MNGSSKADEDYLAGRKLYGDDFPPEAIKAWHKDEQEGYANLGARKRDNYQYAYHALNRYHGFSKLDNLPVKHVLGFGSAYGHELLPILDRIDRITIVDPSDAFAQAELRGVPLSYVKADVLGNIAGEDESFDLTTCFGVLHHIPNVSHVMNELRRCCSAGGHVLLREPIVSMGNWSRPRSGLTRRERGIPLGILDEMIRGQGFMVLSRAYCIFRPWSSFHARFFGGGVYSNGWSVIIDHLLASLFRWNYRCHAESVWKKIRPTSVFYVLQRP